MSLVETIKSHPLATVAIVIVVGGGTLWVMSSGGGNAPIASGGYAGSGTQFQDQLQSSQQNTTNVAAALQASAAHDASNYDLALLSLQAFNANEETKRFQITKETEASNTISTLNARVQEASINAGVTRDQIAATNATNLANISANTQQTLVSTLASITNAQTSAAASVQNHQISAAQAVATQSWWDSIFG